MTTKYDIKKTLCKGFEIGILVTAGLIVGSYTGNEEIAVLVMPVALKMLRDYFKHKN